MAQVEKTFDQEAELAVINIILNNPETIYLVPNLKPFMFSSTHSLIYATVLELIEQAYVPEPSLVRANMESKGRLQNVGGVDYFKYICEMKFAKENLKEFERQVVKNYKARSLLSTFAEYHAKIINGDNPDEIIINLNHRIEDLTSNSGGEQVVTIESATIDMWKELTYRVEHPGIKGIPTGFRNLDLLTGGYNPGDLWVVAGRPGMGKTADMCNSVLAVARSGHPVLVFSLEMNKISLAERMVSMISEVPLAEIRLGTVDKKQMDKVSDAIKEVKNLPIYIDTNFGTDNVYFASTIRKYHMVKGIDIAFLDYIQLGSERGDNQTAEIGAFSRTAKLLANDLAMTMVVNSQLNRAVEMRDDKHPVLSDLRQSGNLEEDADIVEFLYRDEYYNKKTEYKGVLEKMISKHRNGPTGSLFYTFDMNTLRIMDR